MACSQVTTTTNVAENPVLRELKRLSVGNYTIILSAGSILDYTGDAIVNAANGGCVSGFGLDEQVNQCGGIRLRQARQDLKGCATGQAKITESFNHKKVKWIIHSVGPVYRINRFKDGICTGTLEADAFHKERDPLLASAYRESLRTAREYPIERLGFCLLSAGVFRGERSLFDVIRIGLQTVFSELRQNSCSGIIKEVTFVAFTVAEQEALIQVSKKIFPENDVKDM